MWSLKQAHGIKEGGLGMEGGAYAAEWSHVQPHQLLTHSSNINNLTLKLSLATL